jgi:L-ascorbate metabolism protein UlaG (beta-lactamase superfamily)
MPATLTWLGSNAFRLTSAKDVRLYVDPWIENQDCPTDEREPKPTDLVILTHGHFDHVGQTMEIWRRFSPIVVAPQDVRRWLQRQGLPRDDRYGPDIGGTVTACGLAISLTSACHSGGAPDGSYGGAPCGIVLELESGLRIYFAGDTGVFGDMALIARMYRPEIAVLPIGGHYTMDPRGAAIALELLGVRRCIPSHYRYGPDPAPPRAILPGKPDELRRLAPPDVEIIAPAPGETIVLR